MIAGTWYIFDHGEMLHVARRILARGTLDLRSLDDPPGTRPVLEFAQPAPGRPSRSRLLPIPALTAVPLLAADEVLGWGDERNFGRLVHLQGALFVLLSLGLVGWSVRRSGASTAAAAMAVALTGLAWPTCKVARRVGPEPILMFLVSAFIAAGIARRQGSRAAAFGELLICVLLPWTHATGPLIAAALAGSIGLEHLLRSADGVRDLRGALRSMAPTLVAAAVGIISMLWLWNELYQGHWWGGGYGRAALRDPLTLRNPLVGLWLYGRDFGFEASVLLVCVVAGVRRAGRAGAEGLAAAVAVTGILWFFFALFPPSFLIAHEPARRLAACLPAWGVVAGTTWDRLAWRPTLAKLLLALSCPVVVYSLLMQEQTYFLLPTEVSSSLPQILWVRLMVSGAPWWMSVGPVIVLGVAAAVSLGRTSKLLSAAAPASGLSTPRSR
jgi:hypothetical protein